MGKPTGKRSLGRKRHRWEDNIKIYFQELGRGMDWIDMASDRGCCKCGNEPSESINCGEILD